MKVKPQPIGKKCRESAIRVLAQSAEFGSRFASMGEVIDTLQDRSGLFETTIRCVYRRVTESAGFYPAGIKHRRELDFTERLPIGQRTRMGDACNSPGFPGDPTSFPALLTKAALLDKLGRADEATAVIKTALPFGISSAASAIRQTADSRKETEDCIRSFSV